MTEQGAFKVGDIVKLKSGGPPMTVSMVKVARGAAASPEPRLVRVRLVRWCGAQRGPIPRQHARARAAGAVWELVPGCLYPPIAPPVCYRAPAPSRAQSFRLSPREPLLELSILMCITSRLGGFGWLRERLAQGKSRERG